MKLISSESHKNVNVLEHVPFCCYMYIHTLTHIYQVYILLQIIQDLHYMTNKTICILKLVYYQIEHIRKLLN